MITWMVKCILTQPSLLSLSIHIFILPYLTVNSVLRQQALLSTGLLCRAVGVHLSDKLDDLISLVRENLVGGARKNRNGVALEALQCVSNMVQGLGQPFHDYALSLLEPMLQSGTLHCCVYLSYLHHHEYCTHSNTPPLVYDSSTSCHHYTLGIHRLDR